VEGKAPAAAFDAGGEGLWVLREPPGTIGGSDNYMVNITGICREGVVRDKWGDDTKKRVFKDVGLLSGSLKNRGRKKSKKPQKDVSGPSSHGSLPFTISVGWGVEVASLSS